MRKSWYDYHTISAWSHFHAYDFPRPFSNSDYYADIIRNLFIDKNSSEIVKIELVYDFSNDGGYMSVRVTPPRLNVKIKEIIDIDNFVEWYSERYGEMLFKHEYRTDDINKTTYVYNDGYTQYSIIIAESPKKNYGLNYIMIEFKTY